MREIKFRAWDNKHNKMYFMDNCDFIIERDGVSVFSEFSNDRINKSWGLEQYTGLKDKNGKEIYEGDILSCKSSRSMYQKYGDRYVVFYDVCGFECDYQYGFENYMQNKNIEVIGNIHDQEPTK